METPTVTLAGVLYLLPHTDAVRAHTEREREALAASIAETGVVVPVVTYDRMADAGGGRAVLDGATRLTIAAELKLAQVPIEHLGGLSEDAARALCLSLNADRRHLNVTEQQARRKERIAAAVQLKDAGLSTRAIAKGLGVSKTQVIADLAAAGTSDNGGQGCPPDRSPASELEQSLRTLHSTCGAMRRAQQAFERLANGPLGGRLTQILSRHNAECAIDSLLSALNDLTAEAVQGVPDAEV